MPIILINSQILFSEILRVPDLSHFHDQKSGDKSGRYKSEDAQYLIIVWWSQNGLEQLFFELKWILSQIYICSASKIFIRNIMIRLTQAQVSQYARTLHQFERLKILLSAPPAFRIFLDQSHSHARFQKFLQKLLTENLALNHLDHLLRHQR